MSAATTGPWPPSMYHRSHGGSSPLATRAAKAATVFVESPPCQLMRCSPYSAVSSCCMAALYGWSSMSKDTTCSTWLCVPSSHSAALWPALKPISQTRRTGGVGSTELRSTVRKCTACSGRAANWWVLPPCVSRTFIVELAQVSLPQMLKNRPDASANSSSTNQRAGSQAFAVGSASTGGTGLQVPDGTAAVRRTSLMRWRW